MNLKSNNYSLDLKLRVVNAYLKEQYTVADICDIFKISKSSVYNWIKLYKNNELTNKISYVKPTSNFRNKDIRNFIFNFINKNPNFIFATIIDEIKSKLNYDISKSTLYSIIHDLNFSKKVAKFKKIYGSEEKLKIKKEALQKQIKNITNDKIISIDEVSFDTNIIHNYGWSIKNVPVIKTIGATYKRLTMICAISNKKVIHYKIINNSAKADTFLDFLKNIPNTNNKYLFLDNAVIHHSKIVKEYVKANNLNLLFNVPYSPQFNPIECMFSKIKKNIKDYNNNNTTNILKSNIISSLKKITSTDLNNFFNHSFNKLRNNT